MGNTQYIVLGKIFIFFPFWHQKGHTNSPGFELIEHYDIQVLDKFRLLADVE